MGVVESITEFLDGSQNGHDVGLRMVSGSVGHRSIVHLAR